MNCKFCNNILKLLPSFDNDIDHYYCENCEGLEYFIYITNPNISNYRIIRYYNGKKYCMSFDVNYNKFNLYNYSSEMYPSKPILTLDYLPDITTENFCEKLPLLLTFA